jgi:CAAX prenyl protease-like protein
MSSTELRPSAKRSPFASSIHKGSASLARGWLPRVAPFAVFIALLAAAPVLDGLVDPRWLLVGRYLVAAALLALFWPAYLELKTPGPGTGQVRARYGPVPYLAPVLAPMALGVAVAIAWVWLDFGWTHIGEPGKGFDPSRADGSLDPILVVLRLFGFVLVVPVMEELFWRSFLMRRIDRVDFLSLDPRAASTLAVVVTSLVFALEHREWLAGIVAGLVYGSLYRRTGNLRACIASHASTNLTIAGWILATGAWRLW